MDPPTSELILPRMGLPRRHLPSWFPLPPREKVVRVALSALVNLATCSAEEFPGPAGMTKVDGGVFLTDMLACKLLKSIQFLEERQFTDPDIVEDIKTLHKLR